MALTPDAAALTDDHRRRQAQVAAYVLLQLGNLWPKLDPRDLDNTREPWLRGVAQLVAKGHTASATLAAAYLPAFRALERVPGEAPAVPLSVPDLERIIGVQAYLGPIRHLERLRGGADPDDSWRIAQRQTLAAGQQHTLDGGRAQTLATVAADGRALGWVRVTSAGACAFCQMLASRGPTYKTERGGSFQAHPGCNCGVEPSYSLDRDAWPPRSRLLSAEWDTVTKGLSNDEARLAWRRHVEGRAGDLDAKGTARADAGRRAGRMAETTDATKTKSGRGRELVRGGRAVDAAGKRKAGASAASAPTAAAQAEAQLRALTVSLARLEARKAAGEDVDVALTWQRERVAALTRELGPEVAQRAATEAAEQAANAGQAAGLNATQAAARVAAERQAADKATRAAAAQADEAAELAARQAVDAERAELRAREAELVRQREAAQAEEARKAADGAELDDEGRPWRLTVDYLEDLDEDGVDELVDYCAAAIATDNPLALARWEDLEVWLDYREREAGIVEQAGNVADAVIDRELAELVRTHGRAGLTHRADDVELLDAAAAAKPTRADVQREWAYHLEELYLKAEDATRGHMVNAKGQARGVTGDELLKGDVRRLVRYGSEELLEFFESTPRVQWSEFYAQRTGSQALAELADKQRERNARVSRDRDKDLLRG